ncbi:hypothetical protein QQ008_19885 [Fulvivirgaceae bacterium BMA10]|uniref:Glycosyltransferase n=1 Tax=Splendidivirga corallicola TaxID=3051826 RepID=A0ABT8KSD1_9BACT|nr:hypothetical protein [Fulvivirgaceae bacterium BMA10]
MVLFYAMGGGMGHLMRIKVLSENLNIHNFKILTSNDLAFQLFDERKILFVEPDLSKIFNVYKKHLKNLIRKSNIKQIYLDAFPNGLLGELDWIFEEKDLKLTYIARRLIWKNYKPFLKATNFHFHKVIKLEPLENDHEAFINASSGNITTMLLKYPDPDADKTGDQINHIDSPIWLIVHAFHKEELEQIIEYAVETARLENKEPYWVIISNIPVDTPEPGILIDSTHAFHWFPVADKIFSACGFNTAYQLKGFRDKHISIPFPRKFDDQFWRKKYLENQNAANREKLVFPPIS